MNADLSEKYLSYYEWLWILELIRPDYSCLYEEVFERFARTPEDLYKLSWREFEILLDSIFRNNGYRTELGPGRADEGVDLRLYFNDVVGESLTLVQAKRYASERAIGLEAVMALSGAVEHERANRGVMVTTSRYLPGAVRFAARQNRRLELASSAEVQQWCRQASGRIVRDKSRLVSADHLRSLIGRYNSREEHAPIVHANVGHNMVLNSFCLVLRETANLALLLRLPTETVDHDGYGQRGHEVPIVDDRILGELKEGKLIRAKKKKRDNGTTYLWGAKELHSEWNGEKKWFDICD